MAGLRGRAARVLPPPHPAREVLAAHRAARPAAAARVGAAVSADLKCSLVVSSAAARCVSVMIRHPVESPTACLPCENAAMRPSCRRNPEFERLYTQFTHFNPIQTQVRAGRIIKATGVAAGVAELVWAPRA